MKCLIGGYEVVGNVRIRKSPIHMRLRDYLEQSLGADSVIVCVCVVPPLPSCYTTIREKVPEILDEMPSKDS